MPRPPQKPSLGSGKKERYEILFEEVNSKMDLVLNTLDGLKGLPQRVEGVEFRLGRIEQESSGFRLVIMTNCNELQRLQHDIQKLQHDVVKLTERIEIHEKLHAT